MLKRLRHLKELVVEPGGCCTTADEVVISTVLGSCVSVCLRDEQAHVAGMNHFMLPAPASGKTLFYTEAGRYGVNAMELLINGLLKLGARRERLSAKVFGGANVLEAFERAARLPRSNIELARRFLNEERIRVVSEDTGGRLGRKLLFHTGSGEVYIRKLGHRPRLHDGEQVEAGRTLHAGGGELTVFEDEGG